MFREIEKQRQSSATSLITCNGDRSQVLVQYMYIYKNFVTYYYYITKWDNSSIHCLIISITIECCLQRGNVDERPTVKVGE